MKIQNYQRYLQVLHLLVREIETLDGHPDGAAIPNLPEHHKNLFLALMENSKGLHKN
jgi:hypothetical protein